ncbi:Hypothetical Protein FCC1311_007422 [Hondaea fermentalgiana]|uniref:Uncharacterized protein n=1 Tax=Hondaea fermentalgiana TaxID=2315210 RepID=A0A2R5G7R3_9STRA|nr:Hypothetical Protein FCC1311_007422 [Hondaea fermentalgiana]|eukprot:GBG24523.1 Hypothetical Protein FCC1311_007422 [Hondaea fermentalgiana]
MASRGGGYGRGGRGGGGGGRGEYYRNKYGGGRGGGGGGGGRGRGRGGYGGGGGGGYGGEGGGPSEQERSRVRSSDELYNQLVRLDNKPFGAYKDLYGTWSFQSKSGRLSLVFDHIQSDPFASPTRAHICISPNEAGFAASSWASPLRKLAFCDYLSRSFTAVARAMGADQKQQSAHWGGAKGGDISMDTPSQHILERTSVLVANDGSIEARFTIGLPARGRSILGEWAFNILSDHLPTIAERSLFAKAHSAEAIERHLRSVEDQSSLRTQLRDRGLAAFVANGSVLPRASGASDAPMDASQAIPFESPESLAETFELPNAGKITGMAIPRGVTLIVGGGFHGKSTVLQALEKAVYNQIPGDGREFVACSEKTVKVRAEDGRNVSSVNISPFISNLPFGRDTTCFSTSDASGSTSQATNILEALEAGADTLLIDEDTCATNFMIRDERMMELVSNDKEPIKPFISKVRALYDTHGVSTILVIGGAGDYFEVADTVVMMDSYKPFDVTTKAKAIARRHAEARGDASGDSSRYSASFAGWSARAPLPDGFVPRGEMSSKVVARRLDTISYGDLNLDLGGLEQLVEVSQVRAIADIMQWLVQHRAINGKRTLREILQLVDAELEEKGLDAFALFSKTGNLVRPRRFEIAGAINRLRTARFAIEPSSSSK